MKKERILLLSGNFYPELTGIGKYNGEMIEWLAKQGHDCTVVTTFPYYPEWKAHKPYTRRSYWFKTETISIENSPQIRVIRCPHYIPKKPSGKNRLISEFSYFLSAMVVIVILMFKKRFDQVISVAPPFEIGFLGLFYKMVRGGNTVYHIQDLQIDAARDLKMIKSERILNAFLSAEKVILKHSNHISTISFGMIGKVRQKIDRPVHFFPNWVETKKFFPMENKRGLKERFGFSASDKVVLYSGAIGKKQGLETILHSAKMLENVDDIKFAICGSGPFQANLEKLKEEMKLSNVVFLPLQPASDFNDFLNMADIHLVLQKSGASDLVMPSKLSTILSVGGVALVTASPGTSLYETIVENNIGVVIEPESHSELSRAVIELEGERLLSISTSARRYAQSQLSTQSILHRYFSTVLKMNSAVQPKPVAIPS